MKLSEKDKALLESWGHPKSDFPQIEEAMSGNVTKFELNEKRISRDAAIKILGHDTFLSGIARSAFHSTAARMSLDGQIVIFDSSKLFRQS